MTPLFALPPTLASAQGAWLTLPSLDTGRSHLAAATAPCPGAPGHKDKDTDACVYAIDGTTTGANVVNTVQAYNPATNTWINVASPDTKRRDLAAATAPCPGSGGEKESTGEHGTAGGHGSTDDHGSTGDHRSTCVYAFGGTDGSIPLTTVEAYDPTTNVWTPVAPLNTARTDLAGAAAPCPRNVTGLKGICVYAIGGTTTADRTVEAYSPETNRWEYLPDLPTIRSGLAAATALCPAAVVGRKELCVYAVGGGTTNAERRRVEVFLPVAGVWATLPDLPTPRSELAAAGAPCPTQKDVSCVYAVGGANAAGNPLDATETYNPAANIWGTLPQLPTRRTELAATSAPCPDDLRRHCVYAIGGEDGTRLATVEAFDIDQ
ncbi:kelch repeat-containing protein [Streptomyces sp. NPDC002588]|uniref:Kelch repeat-containing protein n=1 Tax=Streptomyces sp. NPDC002588 TaxID=3154419 RepID=UPI003332416D